MNIKLTKLVDYEQIREGDYFPNAANSSIVGEGLNLGVIGEVFLMTNVFVCSLVFLMEALL